MKFRYFLAGALSFAVIVFLINTTFFSSKFNTEGPYLIAHRGLAQDFSREGLDGNTCTAAQMIPSGHEYLENTIPSIEAAFQMGASFVEIDVHRTTDDSFAIFHDWTLDCRTNGTGVTRNHTLVKLQSLDIGYGYTSDGGKTYPFRGKGVGMMPSLSEVMTRFPDENFIIDIKSNDHGEGELLAKKLEELSPGRSGKTMVYGGAHPVKVVKNSGADYITLTRPGLKQCLIKYFAIGWTGYVPSDCENSMLMIPKNIAPWLWGWPSKFEKRMHQNGSVVFLLGDYHGEGYSIGFNKPDEFKEFLSKSQFSGGIWTDYINEFGPILKSRQHNHQ